ncbi:MAG: type II secretion system protein [Planctomycetota bacterium]
MKTARTRRRGFSLVEVLVALAIVSTLMVSVLGALQASFDGYKVANESAASHVVARMVTHRVSSMVRTGTDFGPFPANAIRTPVLVPDPPRIEFATGIDAATGLTEVVKLERRAAPTEVIDAGGAPFELWYVRSLVGPSGVVGTPLEQPLLTDVQSLRFTMYYEPGPRLDRLTMDLIIRPPEMEDAAVAAGLDSPSFRFFTTVSPRRQD